MGLDVPNRFYKLGFEEGRKQGQIGCLEWILSFYGDGKVRKTINISVAVLEKRLKDLEKEV